MVSGKTTAIVSTEGSGGVIAIQQGIVHSGNDAVECGFADTSLWRVDLGAITQVILLQTLVGEVVCANTAVC